MVRIEAVIRPEMFEAVREGLNDIGVLAMTVDEVHGCGHQAGHKEYYRGMEADVKLLHKIRITTVVHEIPVDLVVDTIVSKARTGAHGDGKIFIMPLIDTVRVRDGMRGGDAV